MSDSMDKAAAVVQPLLSDAVLKQVPRDEQLLLAGILQLVQCLLRCEEYRECLQILTRVLNLNGDHDPHTVYFAQTRSDHLRSLQSTISQLLCISGHCFEQMEQKKRAVTSFQIALAVDCRCIEAFLYLAKSPLLSWEEKEAVKDSCVQRCLQDESEHRYLASLYDQALAKQQLRRGLPTMTIDLQPALQSVELAESLFNRGCYSQAHILSKRLLSHDPLCPAAARLCLSSMILLNKTDDLFCLAHELMASQPKQALSWYAVGCYYYALAAAPCANSSRSKDLCLTYLRKACKRDKRFANAFLLLGHTLSGLEESDQAMAAYRTASRLLPEETVVWISMGQELIRINSCSLATHALLQAQSLSPWNANVCNELGVACLRLQRKDEALKHLHRAAELLVQQQTDLESEEVVMKEAVERASNPARVFHSFVFANYATALRQARFLEEAIVWYQRAISVNPHDGMTLAELGFTMHLMRRFDEAILFYHKALALQPQLSVASELLSHALNDTLFYLSASSIS